MINKVPFNYIFIDNTKKAIKIPKEKYLSVGTIPVVDQGQKFIGGYVDGLKGYTNIPCIIFGDHTRIIKYVDFPFTIGADGVKLLNICNSDFIPKFLFYHLSYYKIPNIGYNRHFKFLKELHFIKYDLQTQQKIVDELDCLSDIIEKKKQQLVDLDNLIKSQFIEMFGDPFSDARFELNELNSICDVRDGTHDSPKYHTTGYPLITSKNIVNGIISFENVNLICKEDYDKINQRSFVDNGDILMPMIGTIGNPVIVNKTREFAIKNVALIKFLKESKVVNHFLYYLMKSDTFNNYLQEKNKGGTQKFVSLGIIRKIKIITPPIELQNKFADFVKHMDKLKFELKQSIEETQNLFNERMQHYFGE